MGENKKKDPNQKARNQRKDENRFIVKKYLKKIFKI
jgi:hypothetical protein